MLDDITLIWEDGHSEDIGILEPMECKLIHNMKKPSEISWSGCEITPEIRRWLEETIKPMFKECDYKREIARYVDEV